MGFFVFHNGLCTRTPTYECQSSRLIYKIDRLQVSGVETRAHVRLFGYLAFYLQNMRYALNFVHSI